MRRIAPVPPIASVTEPAYFEVPSPLSEELHAHLLSVEGFRGLTSSEGVTYATFAEKPRLSVAKQLLARIRAFDARPR